MMFSKKFELTDETITVAGKTLYRIRALKDFDDIKKGDLGGFLELEENLSHEGLCWITDNACIQDDARVSDNAKVSDYAVVSGCVKVLDNAKVSDYAWVSDNARVSDYAKVSDYAWVSDNARVSGNAIVSGNARISGDAKVYHGQRVRYGKLETDVFKNKDWKQALYNLYGILPVKNKIILYKKINKNWSSLYDSNFIYPKEGIVEIEDYNEDIKESCSSGLHFADPKYWDEGDILIAAEIDLNDIITIQDGKVRVRKANILEEVSI